MDSRIEELAQIIRERAASAADNVRRAADGVRGDRYHSWRSLESLAMGMLRVIEDYRREHPEEYGGITLSQAAERERCIEVVMTELDSNGQAHAIAEAIRGMSA